MIARRKNNMNRVAIKLFQKILKKMKIYLKDESSAIWEIFKGLFFFQLWMYEERLINIDQIVLSAISDENSITAEYFLPEIIENDPENFYKEIKFRFPVFSDENAYSNEAIQKLKEKRQKYFNWILNCDDFYDQSYREMETDQLRLAIKTDDVELFQRTISNNNFSVNMTIRESIQETFLSRYLDISLIKYAINFNSVMALLLKVLLQRVITALLLSMILDIQQQ